MTRKERAADLFAEIHDWPEPEAWEQSDARALASLLHSEVGQKMLAHLRFESISNQERAVLAKGDAFSSGIACGFKGFLNWLEALSAQLPESQTGDHEEEGDLDHLAP